ncbi:MAG TPA: tRNA pseudouridine(38-40) synthase TruA [Blastocatellia bacterium]|nr:tRNA pseudouridine(38-40) synthase TruA [Blastocatellia bacterium]
MPVWKLTIEYDGTRYYGWQEQKNSRTVAGELRGAAEKFFEERVDLAGAGRTDAGVHALAQIARLKASRGARPVEVLYALNDRLPADINVLKVEETSASFDPRRDAISRSYVYQISIRRTAFAKKFVWWVRDPLNVEAISKAAAFLKGRHDFRNFCERQEDDRSTLVVVQGVELAQAGDLILFRIVASHFLWKMVRRIVGALVEVGRGRLTVEDFASLLRPTSKPPSVAKSFDVAAFTAPPSGLFLENVVYRDDELPGELVPPFPCSNPRRLSQ